MSSTWVEIVVYVASIPDTPDLPRTEVLDRLHRAFEFADWKLTVNEAGEGLWA